MVSHLSDNKTGFSSRNPQQYKLFDLLCVWFGVASLSFDVVSRVVLHSQPNLQQLRGSIHYYSVTGEKMIRLVCISLNQRHTETVPLKNKKQKGRK